MWLNLYLAAELKLSDLHAMPRLSIITPCYYNEANLDVTLPALLNMEKLLADDVTVEYVLVDDGSKDQTWARICAWKDRFPDRVKAVKLSGNFGAFNAILAGMQHATGEANVILTADLQDPPELIPKMLDYWRKGIKFVVANRTDREESFSQKLFSNTYHYLIRRYGIKHIPSGGFDLVLFDAQLRDQVVAMNEGNTNIIYLLAWLKYDYVAIPYVRRKREIGTSRWTLRKKIKLFIDSFASFSFMPVRAISALGFLLAVAGFIYALIVIGFRITSGVPVSGWTSLMLVLLIVSGFQMIALGVLGEYLWRTLEAARKRPAFIVDQVYAPADSETTTS